VVNDEVMASTGADQAFLDEAVGREQAEVERRRAVYLGGRPRISRRAGRRSWSTTAWPPGRRPRRRYGPWPPGGQAPGAGRAGGPPSTLEEMRREADEIVCLETRGGSMGVGAFFDDFTS